METEQSEPNVNPSLFVANKDVEPEVICYDLLYRLIREQGHKGEAGRLCLGEAINFKNILVLNIEFQNILLIDHLWMLTNLQKLSLKCNKIDKIENLDLLVNLRELDLSFNYIEKIENLECLTKLEFLSLFGNRLSKLENLDALVNLVRLSLGNNQIDSLENVERLRFMSKLYSLNLEGNPAIINFQDGRFCCYIAALLPNLKYYNYKFLTVADREEGCNLLRSELRAIQEAETEEIEQRDQIARELEDEIRLTTCFVEFLNGFQLIDSLFAGDENARVLLSVVGAEALFKEYRNQVYKSTQKIYKLGLEKHESRAENIAEFNEAVEDGIRQIQHDGIQLVNPFLETKEINMAKIKELNTQISNEGEKEDANDSIITECYAKINELTGDFETLIDETWYSLMDLEMTLHERIDESNATFAHTIQDMLYEFVENAQLYFVEITEAESEFSDRLHELVTNYLSKQSSSDDLHPNLKKCLTEKDLLSNLIASSRDFRNQVIDKREELLVSRSRIWVTKLIEDNNLIERSRNRKKLVEIHTFIDEHRMSFAEFIENIGENSNSELEL